MLPPFVPPSARVSREELPWITEFAADRAEERKERVFEAGVAVVEAVAEAAADTAAAVQEMAGTTPEMAGLGTEPARKPEPLPPITDFVVGVVEPAPSAGTGEPAMVGATVETTEEGPSAASADRGAEPPPVEDGWISDERNAFDWHGVATLAARRRDEERAASEWETTEWESGSPDADRAAAVLVQLARRIRSGELTVDATPGMSQAATLAATLMALLGEDR